MPGVSPNQKGSADPDRPSPGSRLSTGAAGESPGPEPAEHPGLPTPCRSVAAPLPASLPGAAPGATPVLRPLRRRPSASCMPGAAPRDPREERPTSPTAQTAARTEPSRRISSAAPRPQTGPGPPTPGAELETLARSPLPAPSPTLCGFASLCPGWYRVHWVPRSPRHRPLSLPAPGAALTRVSGRTQPHPTPPRARGTRGTLTSQPALRLLQAT